MEPRLSLHSILIFVPDLEVGRDFYCNVLGFEIVTVEGSHILMRGADFDLHLFECESSGSSAGYSSRAGSSVALAVHDLDRAMSDLRIQGVRFLHEQPSAGPAGRYVAFTDPFGTVHELVESKG